MEAKWGKTKKHWHLGSIAKVNGNGTYDVIYHDGSEWIQSDTSLGCPSSIIRAPYTDCRPGVKVLVQVLVEVQVQVLVEVQVQVEGKGEVQV